MGKREQLYSLAKEYAMGFLKNGREGWDIPHTRAVFYYAKKLTKASEQDELVIPTAAWLHDTGYFGKFMNDSHDYDAVQDRKTMHMLMGAELARTFVIREDVSRLLTVAQGERIVHLVLVHDNYSIITDLDESILVEADALGTLDVKRVKPTFDHEGRMKFLDELYRLRKPVFRTELGEKVVRRISAKI